MRVLRHHLSLLALFAAGACAAGAAGPAYAATSSASSTGGSSATDGASQNGSSAVTRSAIATWYGPGLYGHKTACGQTLTPALIGVANRTLPCGTLVRVSYDGHSKIVPVLDRGPYADNGASWDLTAGAANALEITETVRITTLVVGAAPNSLTLGAPAVTPGEAAFGGAQAG